MEHGASADEDQIIDTLRALKPHQGRDQSAIRRAGKAITPDTETIRQKPQVPNRCRLRGTALEIHRVGKAVTEDVGRIHGALLAELVDVADERIARYAD